MDRQPFGLPAWVENLLLGHLTSSQRARWIGLLVLMMLLVPAGDYSLGRGFFHLNLYPIPVVLSIFLFGEAGLFSVLVVLAMYHAVQVRLGLEPHAMMVNSLGQLGVTFVVGLVCSWLVGSYRALYNEKANLALSRHQLLLSLTHEIRSPLFAVRGIVRNLTRNITKLSPSDVVEQLNEAQAAIAALNQDVEGLTQVFRADLRETEPQVTPVPPQELLSSVLKRFPPDFRPAHSIVWTVEEGLSSVLCDPLLTQQILDNLISNSLRHTTGGEVSVHVQASGDEVRFVIADQGAGILPADRQKIFARFERGSRGAASGFGVGLYLVEVYAKVQGGRVTVDDVPSGAQFSVYLPAKRDQ